ncbi:MAG TPA: substrate-binding domain-containing protein [Acidimicrobiales bacterium]|nr:substrate-binding domain-containing protein [Acidimicrobiales bacterium]
MGRHRRRRLRTAAAIAVLAASPALGPAANASARRGVAEVAYAGSLTLLNERVLGPAFSRATGYGYEGRGAGADALAAEIAAGAISANVFESVGPGPIVSLEPRLTRWLVRFASCPLVLAYNPASPFATRLAAIARGRGTLRQLLVLLASPSFRLGRTDPNVDPQGAAFVEMLELAQRRAGLEGGIVRRILRAPAPGSGDSAEIFDEVGLEARLQAGQLDAASAYLPEARALHLPYVPLPTEVNLGDPRLASLYSTASLRLADGAVVHGQPISLDVTVIGRPAAPAAAAFVAYLLSNAGRRAVRSFGYTLTRPVVVGPVRAVPAVVRRALAR